MRSAVVLPHPDGPSSTMNSLSAISSDSESTATTSPNRFVTSSNTTSAIGLPVRARGRSDRRGGQVTDPGPPFPVT